MEYQIKFQVKIKQLHDFPLHGRNIYVILKWGSRTLWGGQTDKTDSVPCRNRRVEWTKKNEFKYSSKVYLENTDLTKPSNRERLWKKQPSSARLVLSVCHASDRTFGKHQEYGKVSFELVDWVIQYHEEVSVYNFEFEAQGRKLSILK